MKFKKTMYHFDFFSDSGHGWLRVRKDFLIRLGIEKLITPYSYMRGDYAYLEEDCDYGTFYNKMKELGLDFKPKYHSTDNRSRIRNYDCYKV